MAVHFYLFIFIIFFFLISVGDMTTPPTDTSHGAWLDVWAAGLDEWTKGSVMFDVGIFIPLVRCHRHLPLEAAHRRNEKEQYQSLRMKKIRNTAQSHFLSVSNTSGHVWTPSDSQTMGLESLAGSFRRLKGSKI